MSLTLLLDSSLLLPQNLAGNAALLEEMLRKGSKELCSSIEVVQSWHARLCVLAGQADDSIKSSAMGLMATLLDCVPLKFLGRLVHRTMEQCILRIRRHEGYKAWTTAVACASTLLKRSALPETPTECRTELALSVGEFISSVLAVLGEDHLSSNCAVICLDFLGSSLDAMPHLVRPLQGKLTPICEKYLEKGRDVQPFAARCLAIMALNADLSAGSQANSGNMPTCSALVKLCNSLHHLLDVSLPEQVAGKPKVSEKDPIMSLPGIEPSEQAIVGRMDALLSCLRVYASRLAASGVSAAPILVPVRHMLSACSRLIALDRVPIRKRENGIISSDGFRLPLAVYNSLLPLLQLRGARILQLVIQHFGKCSTLMQFAQLVSDLCTTVLEKASWRGISGAVMAQALQADSLLESKDEVSSGGWPTLQPKADAAGNTAPQTAPTIELEHDGIENGGIRDQSLLVLALRCSLAWDQCLGSGLGRQFGRVLLIACVRLIHTAIRVNASHSMLQIVSGAVGGQGSKVHGGGKRKRQRVSVATHQSATKPASEEAGGQEQNASKGDYFSLTGDDEAAGTAADFKTVGAASPSAIAVILALQNLEQILVLGSAVLPMELVAAAHTTILAMMTQLADKDALIANATSLAASSALGTVTLSKDHGGKKNKRKAMEEGASNIIGLQLKKGGSGKDFVLLLLNIINQATMALDCPPIGMASRQWLPPTMLHADVRAALYGCSTACITTTLPTQALSPVAPALVAVMGTIKEGERSPGAALALNRLVSAATQLMQPSQGPLYDTALCDIAHHLQIEQDGANTRKAQAAFPHPSFAATAVREIIRQHTSAEEGMRSSSTIEPAGQGSAVEQSVIQTSEVAKVVDEETHKDEAPIPSPKKPVPSKEGFAGAAGEEEEEQSSKAAAAAVKKDEAAAPTAAAESEDSDGEEEEEDDEDMMEGFVDADPDA